MLYRHSSKTKIALATIVNIGISTDLFKGKLSSESNLIFINFSL